MKVKNLWTRCQKDKIKSLWTQCPKAERKQYETIFKKIACATIENRKGDDGIETKRNNKTFKDSQKEHKTERATISQKKQSFFA